MTTPTRDEVPAGTGDEAEVVEAPATTEVHLTYAGVSALVGSTTGPTRLALATEMGRPPVRFDAAIRDPIPFREAMAALHAVVSGDFRYRPRDRTAYLAYQRMRRETARLNVWQAQREYFGWLLRNDPLAFVVLDPVITVHPDQVMFEVFSKDEGAYARLGVDRDAFTAEAGEPSFGTTHIDFSPALFQGLQQMRSDRETRLAIGQEGVRFATSVAGEVIEKQVQVPDSWLRGFLQVQSAAVLPRQTFTLAPVDLYNALRYLRMHADRKGQKRGLRIELVPGQPPRMVLEPWNEVIPGTSAPFTGRAARVVRLWGRRRLSLLARFLPFADEVEVHTLGSGLPSFWLLRGRGMTLTLGLTGFTAANWSQALNFDLLLPRKAEVTTGPLETVVAALRERWSAGAGELARITGLAWPALTETLQLGCQQGRLMYDLGRDVYRFRPLTDAPVDPTRLEFRDRRERTAFDLLTRRGAVAIVSENRIPNAGLELTGKVEVREDGRDYRPQMLLSDDGMAARAECTCAAFRKQGIKAGPCVHLIALRLAYAEQVARRARGEGDGTGQPTMIETRSYTRRGPKGEEVYLVSWERHKLRVRWGLEDQPARLQTLAFPSAEAAGVAFRARVADLEARGFLDATAV